MLTRTLLLLLAALPLHGDDGSATTEQPLPADRQAVLDRQLRGLTAQGTQMCINRRRIRDVDVLSDERLLFRVSQSLVYENRMDVGCPGMARSPYLPQPARETGAQLCSGDLMVEADDGATCALGQFIEWRRLEPAAQ